MATTTYQSYEEASQVFLAQFKALLDVPEEGAPGEGARVARRGAGGVAAEVLVDRAERVAETSAQLVPLARGYLAADDLAAREGVSAQLITQASAELSLAAELLAITPAHAEAQPSGVARRGTDTTGLRDAVTALERSLQTPVSAGLAPLSPAVRGTAAPTTPDDAKQAVQTAASQALTTIAMQVRELGGDIAFDLVSATKWRVVVETVGALRPEIAAKLASIKQAVNALVSRAVAVAAKTLLNAYDKVLALFGADAAAKAREQIEDWLKQIEKEKRVELFDALVDKLYGIGAAKQELASRLATTTATVDTLNQSAAAVTAIAGRFVVLVGRLRALESVATLGQLLSYPQVVLAVVAIQVALLGILVYAGRDYVGRDQAGFLDLTKGVVQIIEERLG